MGFNSFILQSNRLKLLYRLSENGFKVRMHAYEYLVAYKDKFLCLILLFPRENRVIIKVFNWIQNSKELTDKIVKLIREIEKDISIEIT